MVIKGTMKEVLSILGSMTEEEFRKKLGIKEVKKWFIWKLECL